MESGEAYQMQMLPMLQGSLNGLMSKENDMNIMLGPLQPPVKRYGLWKILDQRAGQCSLQSPP